MKSFWLLLLGLVWTCTRSAESLKNSEEATTSRTLLLQQTVLDLQKETQCLNYFRSAHSILQVELDFPVQVFDKSVKRDELELLPECSWFLFLSNAEDISQFILQHHKRLPKSGKYMIILEEEEPAQTILKLEFFRKVTRAVEFHTMRDHLIKALIRTIDGVKLYNYWNGTRYLLDNPILPRPTRTFGGRVLRATTFDSLPHTYKGPEGNYLGHEPKIMRAISENLDFKMIIQNPPNGEKWGEFKNGSWTGLVGELQMEKSDFGWANLYLKVDRMKIIGFTEFYHSESVCFMIKKPPPYPQWMAVMTPLDIDTWLWVIGSVIVCGALLTIITRAKSTEDLPIDTSLSFLVMFGTIVDRAQQPLDTIKSSSVRILVGVWVLMALVISSGYKGMLISVMTIPLSPKMLNTIREVAEENKPISSFGDTFYELAKQSLDPDLQTISKNYIVHYNFGEALKNVSESVVLMAEGKDFLEYNTRKDFTDEYGERSMHIMKQCMFPFSIAIGLQKDSPYNDRISEKIRQLKEGGIIGKWIQREFDNVGKSAKVDTSKKAEPLTIDNVQVALLLYGFLMPVAALTLAIEVGAKRYQQLSKSL